MATSDSALPSSKPVILINRVPSFNVLFADRLRNFTFVDPISSSITSGPDLHNFLETHAASARLILCIGPSPLSAEVINCLPLLECIVTSCVGIDHIDIDVCRRRGIAVANAGEAFSEDTADFAVGLLIDVLRKVSVGDRYVRARLWPTNGEFPLGIKVIRHYSWFVSFGFGWCRGYLLLKVAGNHIDHRGRDNVMLDMIIINLVELGGKRVGILGLGRIGSFVAKRLLPFGCSIAYNSRKKKQSVPFPYFDNIQDLALNSDILILCCSLIDKTRHIINSHVMTALGKDGVIINVGRGALIDEKELVRFLVEGKIRGAGLDVFEHEPSVPEELFGLDNVVLSPHRAVLTPDSFKGLEDITIANVEAFFSNQALLSQVTLDGE